MLSCHAPIVSVEKLDTGSGCCAGGRLKLEWGWDRAIAGGRLCRASHMTNVSQP